MEEVTRLNSWQEYIRGHDFVLFFLVFSSGRSADWPIAAPLGDDVGYTRMPEERILCRSYADCTRVQREYIARLASCHRSGVRRANG